jgi:acyl-CoA reductase-like NAD-dependent aldehyde dehydrogenase
MLKDVYPHYVANRPSTEGEQRDIVDKFTGKTAAKYTVAPQAAIEEGIAKAVTAARPLREMASFERQRVLQHCVKRFTERSDELAEALCIEAGKPIKDSRGEVARLIDTFKIAEEESVRIDGEVMGFDRHPRSKGYRGMWKRVPIGPCSFISPFNFPLNLAAHKVAPALAVGCPFVLKPASMTPIGALMIGETLAECDLPEGAFSILPCDREHADSFVEDDRLKLLSFTGSPGVGWDMKARAGKKGVVLELGGNAACIVDEDADLDDACARMIIGAFYQTGQSCIGVQRVLIHEKVYDAFKEKFVAATKALKMGNPKDEDTFIGPMISEKEAKRLDGWIQSAVKNGATLLCGGKREGTMLEATLLEDVPKGEDVVCLEAFGPVAVLSKYSKFEDALAEVNDSTFGLQCGIFTRDIHRAMRAWDVLEVGGVLINEMPNWRVDHMPYGGVKDSGIGREGIRHAIEDMTEIRLFIIRDAAI